MTILSLNHNGGWMFAQPLSGTLSAVLPQGPCGQRNIHPKGLSREPLLALGTEAARDRGAQIGKSKGFGKDLDSKGFKSRKGGEAHPVLPGDEDGDQDPGSANALNAAERALGIPGGIDQHEVDGVLFERG